LALAGMTNVKRGNVIRPPASELIAPASIAARKNER
jgi:hypothetical protein